MKKLYTFALCAAATLTAAAQFSLPTATLTALPSGSLTPAQAPAKFVKKAQPAELKVVKNTEAKKAPAKAHETDKWESVGTGKYTDFILSSLWQYDAPTFDVEIEKSTTTAGLYRIAELYKNYTLDEGLVNAGVTYDASKAEPFYFAIDGDAFVFEDYTPGLADDDGDYSVVSQVGGLYPQYAVSLIASVYPDGVGTYSDGVLTYPITMTDDEGTFYNILIACGDPGLGYYAGNKSGQFKIVMPGASETPVDPNEGWTSVGDATFTDPWVIPATGNDQFENSYEVALQQKNDNKNVFRLVDPYGASCPVGSVNQHSTKHGYIQFDITDKDHVTFEAVEAGFANSQLGISKLYCYDVLTYFALSYELDPSAVVAVLGETIPYTTFEEGVVTLGSKTSTDENGNEVTSYDALFGIQNAITGGYSWSDQDDNAVDMSGSIIFPANWQDFVETDAVSNIAVDNTNAPVEFFNLQGQRIANPTAGQLLIRRQGTETTKVLVK